MVKRNIFIVFCSFLVIFSLTAFAFAIEINFTEHSIEQNYRTNPAGIQAVDMDNDNDLDILTNATYWGNGDLSWWENDGNQNYTEHIISQAANWWHSIAVDMDGDGDVDILTCPGYNENSDYRITLWENDGSQNFSPHDIAICNDSGYTIFPIDLDKDGDTDIAIVHNGQIFWLENNGGLSFTEHIIHENDNPSRVYAADLDSDNDIDVIGFLAGSDELAWWENNGSQSFTKHVVTDSFGKVNGLYTIDVDGDGNVDILATNGSGGKISWFSNDGAQNFSEHNIANKGHPARVYAADMDADGDLDVLGTNQGSHEVTWWENDGSQNFTEHTIKSNYNGANGIAVADIDGDNDLDVLAVAYWGKKLAWWENELTCPHILYDSFDAPLEPKWTVERGKAWTQGGWAYLHDPVGWNPYRDSVIIAGEGLDWTNYRFSTRFYAEGGGDGWYQADIYFRVQDMHGWGKGTYYRLNIYTPLWVNPENAPRVHLIKHTGDTTTSLALTHPLSGVINDHDNRVEVEVIGGTIRIAINGFNILEFTDPNPIPAGGVGLGVTWEATTRYDYIKVTPIPELLAEIDSVMCVQAINVLDTAPDNVVFVTKNVGAGCGGGTPASAWKMVLDPDSGCVVSVEKKQELSQIQGVRDSLFESSDGTLFTGGGWCGYKPPYYSTDGGETWQTADAGLVHPPNSTYSFVEFNGDVYAGTGYHPHPGQLYRWLGSGCWELVWDFGYARNIVNSMAVHEGQLFVGVDLYGVSCDPSTPQPVYVSSDGTTFDPTTGIDACYRPLQLLVTKNQLIAWVRTEDSTQHYVYRWNGGSWVKLGDFGLDGEYSYRKAAVSDDGTIYLYGHLSEDPSPGIYRSTDLGLSWQQIVMFEISVPSVHSLHIHDNMLYIGTSSDDNDKGYIYRLRIPERSGNNPPSAHAGSDKTLCRDDLEGADVILDGSGSYDLDDDPLTYVWTWEGGSATSISPTVSLPLGITTITLLVNDGIVDSEPDTVDITIESPLPAVMLYSPSNGAVDVSLTPTLTWNAVPGASSYHLTLKDNFGTVIIDEADLTTTYFNVASVLFEATLYTWKVVAVNACGHGEEPFPFSFTTMSASSPSLTVLTPNGGEVIDSGVCGQPYIIRWNYTGDPGTKVKIEYNTGGRRWTLITETLCANRYYKWWVPSLTSATCRIRVTSVSNSRITDISDGNFQIIKTCAGWVEDHKYWKFGYWYDPAISETTWRWIEMKGQCLYGPYLPAISGCQGIILPRLTNDPSVPGAPTIYKRVWLPFINVTNDLQLIIDPRTYHFDVQKWDCYICP